MRYSEVNPGPWTNNHGVEDPERCVEAVSEPPHYLYRHQCQRKRGHGKDGLYCKQHAKQHPDVTP